jgi:hypothetical protein
VTHTPNVFVGGDSEYAIVANQGAKEYVCEILDGGEDAFLRREQR